MDIQIAQILFQMVNFLVVMGALTYLLYKPVLKIFDERAQRIAEGQQAAQEAIAQQEHIDEMKKEVQKALRKEKADALKAAHQEAEAARATMLEQARQEAQTEIVKLKADWQREKGQLVQETREDLVRAALQAAERVMNEHLDAKKHKQLIDDELKTILQTI